jgi:hypothetical protein
MLMNTGGYAVSKASTVKADSSFLTTVSTAGTYWLSYNTNGTNVYITYSGALS